MILILDVNAEPPSRTLEITAEDSDAQMIEDAPSTRSVRYGKRTTKRAMSGKHIHNRVCGENVFSLNLISI